MKDDYLDNFLIYYLEIITFNSIKDESYVKNKQ